MLTQPPLPTGLPLPPRMPSRLASHRTQSHRKPVHREEVKGLQRHRVVANQEVVIPQQVRQIGRERAPDSCVRLGRYEAATELQAEQLPRVEHLPVSLVSPLVQSRRLVARWNPDPREHTPTGCLREPRRPRHTWLGHLLTGALKNLPLWERLHSGQWYSMANMRCPRGPFSTHGKRFLVPHPEHTTDPRRAGPSTISAEEHVEQCPGDSRLDTSFNRPHSAQCQNVVGMPGVLGHQVSRKEIDVPLAGVTWLSLDP